MLLPSNQLEEVGIPYDVGYQSRSGSEPKIMEEGSDDYWFLRNGYEYFSSVVRHEAQKRFFHSLDALTIEEINKSPR